MGSVYLSTVQPKASEIYYLDTSALLRLTMNEGAKHGQPPLSYEEEMQRAVLDKFMGRATKAGSRVLTTVLAIEEMAAKIRNLTRKDLASSQYGMSFEALKKKDRKKADAIDKDAHAAMVNLLAWSCAVLTHYTIALDTPTVAVDASATFSEALRIDHEKMLLAHPELDAMDALHVVVGMRMNVTGFVSMDQGWRAVKEIAVYHP